MTNEHVPGVHSSTRLSASWVKMFPWMTAYITLPVASATGVLRVANCALRYKPDLTAEQIRALYQKYGLRQHAAYGQASNVAAQSKQLRDRGAGTPGGGTGGPNAGQQHTARADVAVVWKLRADKTLEPVRIRTGITDHTVTEVAQVLNGELNEQAEVVTGAMSGGASAGSRPPGLGAGTPRIR